MPWNAKGRLGEVLDARFFSLWRGAKDLLFIRSRRHFRRVNELERVFATGIKTLTKNPPTKNVVLADAKYSRQVCGQSLLGLVEAQPQVGDSDCHDGEQGTGAENLSPRP